MTLSISVKNMTLRIKILCIIRKDAATLSITTLSIETLPIIIKDTMM